MKQIAVQIENLTKDFSVGLRGSKLRAVDNLSLNIANNEIFGLLGPNGSGKSTTIKILLGLLPASQGACRLFGVSSLSAEARCHVGYLPEAPYFYRYLTGRELVTFYAGICGMSGAERRVAVESVIQRVGMKDAADRRVATYSKGMLQRIGLAQAVVHNPQLVVLDEPTAGVDPLGAAAIGEIILDLKREGKTVLVCSHLLAQLEDLCDRVAILHKGRLMVEGAVESLLANQSSDSLLVEGLDAAGLDAVQSLAKARGGRSVSFDPSRRSLESIFLDVIGKSELKKKEDA
ncbi:MAG: ABC transporter ATP-binding protein [Coraliomargaritaceae bacterium]